MDQGEISEIPKFKSDLCLKIIDVNARPSCHLDKVYLEMEVGNQKDSVDFLSKITLNKIKETWYRFKVGRTCD